MIHVTFFLLLVANHTGAHHRSMKRKLILSLRKFRLQSEWSTGRGRGCWRQGTSPWSHRLHLRGCSMCTEWSACGMDGLAHGRVIIQKLFLLLDNFGVHWLNSKDECVCLNLKISRKETVARDVCYRNLNIIMSSEKERFVAYLLPFTKQVELEREVSAWFRTCKVIHILWPVQIVESPKHPFGHK